MSTSPETAERARSFRERASLEALRYGADPWIFVRELLQNARDAGSTRVRFSVFESEGERGYATVICQDDGEGMTFEHARRFLFALYASSKEGRSDQAGRFGVGFWSVLRFEPVAIVISSRPRQGEAWGVALDGDLARAQPVAATREPGTEIVLRRRGPDAGLPDRIFDAVWQSARFLCQRDRPAMPLEIEVNGRRANADFALGAPSATFRRRAVKGVVGLGPEPKVELFSRGLRVRAAASLEDLLSPAGRHSDWMRVRFAQLPGGVAPEALLESGDLDVALSRADARDTRALSKVVRLAERELERLIERQLAAARPRSLLRRVAGWFWDALPDGRMRPVVLSLFAGCAAAVTVAAWRGGEAAATRLELAAPTPTSVDPGPAPVARAFQDLGRRYRGPDVDVLDPLNAEPLALGYSPPSAPHHFAALILERLDPDGSPAPAVSPRAVKPYQAVPCQRACVEVTLAVHTSGEPTRLPLPTGHRVVAGSVTMAGHSPRLAAAADGHPVVVLDGATDAVLHYQTAPAPDPQPANRPRPTAALPAALLRYAQGLQTVPLRRRVAALVALVRRRVAYDDSEPVARKHREARTRGEGFLQRTLSIGAGDCDVQGAVLTALLQAAAVPARLAIGYLGESGGVLPWVHAWVEYRDGDRWLVADPTETNAAPPHLPVVVGAMPGQSPAATPAPTQDLEPDSDSRALAEAPMTGEPARRFSLWISPLFLLLVGSLVVSRTRRTFNLDASPDLAKLLRGALQQPGAFANVSALFRRPLVPLADGRAISLIRACALAGRGRLYTSATQPLLASGALAAGAVVLDHRREEGQVVADALGAIDLDDWAAMIDSARSEPLLDAVNTTLRRHGEEWEVRASTRARGGLAILDLGPLGSAPEGIRGTRLVIVDPETSWLGEARRQHARHPLGAVFAVLDQLATRLDLPRPRRERLLVEVARAALREGFNP